MKFTQQKVLQKYLEMVQLSSSELQNYSDVLLTHDVGSPYTLTLKEGRRNSYNIQNLRDFSRMAVKYVRSTRI